MKRKLCLVMAIIMSMAFLAGCDGTASGAKLWNAVIASYDMKSAETTFDAKIKVSAEGLSAEDKASFDAAMASIGDITVSGKLAQSISDDRLKQQAVGTMEVGAGGASFKDINVWVDSDFTGDNKKFVEILQMPAAMKGMEPKLQGKDYLVMDLMNMAPGMPDQSDMIKSSVKMNEDAKELVKAMAGDFKPGIDYVSEKDVYTLADGSKVKTYRITLDDAKLKKLMRYSVNYLSDSAVFNKLTESYLQAVTKSMSAALPGNTAIPADKLTGENAKGDFKAEANKALDELDKYKLLGAKGLVMDFGVDEKGFIRKETMNMDLSLDLNQISEGKAKGTLNIAFDMNINLNKINEPIQFTLPTLTKENSITFAEMMKRPAQYFPANADKKMVGKVSFYKVKSVVKGIKAEKYTVKNNTVSFVLDGKTYKLKLDASYVMEGSKKLPVKGAALKKIKNTIYISEKALDAMGIQHFEF